MTTDNPKLDNPCCCFLSSGCSNFKLWASLLAGFVSRTQQVSSNATRSPLVQSVVCACHVCGQTEAQTLISFCSHQFLSKIPWFTRSALQVFSSLSLCWDRCWCFNLCLPLFCPSEKLLEQRNLWSQHPTALSPWQHNSLRVARRNCKWIFLQ